MIQLPHQKRHGRSGGSRVQMCSSCGWFCWPFCHPSTAAICKRGARRLYTPLSSLPARQPIKRSVVLISLARPVSHHQHHQHPHCNSKGDYPWASTFPTLFPSREEHIPHFGRRALSQRALNLRSHHLPLPTPD